MSSGQGVATRAQLDQDDAAGLDDAFFAGRPPSLRKRQLARRSKRRTGSRAQRDAGRAGESQRGVA